MISKDKVLLSLVALGVMALLSWALFRQIDVNPGNSPSEPEAEAIETEVDPGSDQDAGVPVAEDSEVSDAEDDEPEEGAEKTEQEEEAEQEERLVDAFDNLTDTWSEPSKRAVKMEEIDTFVRRFRAVPKARKEECLQRALNLIPDENVMLLAGVLMDKSQDKELLEQVYNDILNRDEDVKKPVLQEIFKDKEHPCWADTAWILDVTGETPEPVEK